MDRGVGRDDMDEDECERPSDWDEVERDSGGEWDSPSWDELGEWLDAPDWTPLLDDDDEAGRDEPHGGGPASDAPTPGERLLYVLGQLYRLHRAGKLAVHPHDFDIDDVARLIGVGPDLEFSTHDPMGIHYHFPTEVLYVNPTSEFPWELLGVWEWAATQEANSFWAEPPR
jgi:hypothetical protein